MILCPQCGHRNPVGAGYCLQCAAVLTVSCSACAAAAPAGSRFCNQCGAALPAPPVAPQRESLHADAASSNWQALIPIPLADKVRQVVAATGERREVTVLFLDFSNFTRIAHERDDEEMYLAIDAAMKLLVELIYEYEGHIDKFTGDGLMALFGLPVTHENDAERAVRAALDMATRLAPLQARLAAENHYQLRARIGIHTGAVVAGALGNDQHMEYTVIGDTVNLASRLEESAEPDTIAVSAVTYQRTRPIFRYESLPPLQLNGYSEAVRAYRPLTLRHNPGRVRGLPGLQVSLVGRQYPLAQLQASLDEVIRTRRARVVVVTGDAGVGKSRLLWEFTSAIARQRPPINTYEGSCQTYIRPRPYWVVADLVRNLANISDNDPPDVQLANLRAHLDTLGLVVEDIVPYLAHLLGLSWAFSALDAQLQLFDADMLQKLTHAAMRQLVLAEATLAPTVLVWEDIHWIDAPSWALLTYLIQTIDTAPVMFILVSRDDQNEPWAHLRDTTSLPITSVQLERLTHSESEALVDQLIPLAAPTVDPLKRQIVRRADGNPFYAEEIVRMLLDEGGLVRQQTAWEATDLAAILLAQVPGTLRGLILARMDALAEPVRNTLQRAAVLGPIFPVQLINLLHPQSATTIRQHLEQLTARQFLSAELWGGEEGRRFQHAMVQDAIYATLLKRRRQQLHLEVALALEQSPMWLQSVRDELLAYHFSKSSQATRAIPYLLAAAANAAERAAHETAAYYYQQLIDLTDRATPRPLAYFQAGIGLGRALKLSGDYAAASQALEPTLRAWAQVEPGVDQEAWLALRVEGLRESADIAQREGDYDAAVNQLETGLAALGTPATPQQITLAHSLIERLVFVRFRQGQLDTAATLAYQVIAETSPDDGRDLVTLASLYNHLGGIAWQQGHSDSAIKYVEQSLRLYQRLGYTWGIANAYSNLGVLNAQCGRWTTAIDQWEKALKLRQEIGDLQSVAISLSNLAQMRLSMGDHQVARQNADQGLALAHRFGDQYQMARLHLILAQLDLVQGQVDAARTRAQLTLKLGDEIGSHDVQVEARTLAALIHGQAGEAEAGLELVKQALQAARSSGLLKEEAECLRVQGILSTQLGDYVKAETSLRESAEFSRQINDPYRQGLTLIALGQLYQTLAQEGGADWRAKAREALHDANVQLSAIGAAYDLQRAQAALAQVERAAAVATAPPTPIGLPQAEHRNVAILWVNLSLPAGIDEEAAFETLAFVVPACATIVQEYNGNVRQRPDGLLGIFGAPKAYEDDAERAVLTAHHILRYLQQSENQPALPLTVHIAVTYGPVVAGQISHRQRRELIIQGEPQQQAQHIAANTPAGRVWVSDSVRAHTQHRFVYHPAPPLTDASLVWELIDLQETPGLARGLAGIRTRFIGREAPLQAMMALAATLARGIGGIVWVEGEAGIGKSRLLREFKVGLAPGEALVWTGACSPQRVAHAFSLFSNLLGQVFDLKPVDGADSIRAKIETAIQLWPADAQATRPYLELLAGIRPGGAEGERLSRLEPEQLRQQTFVAMRRLLRTLARQKPLVLMLDDLHWIDPISAELLIFLATMVTSDPILFVCAQRREGSDSPNDRLVRLYSLLTGQTTRLFLERFSPTDSQTLLAELLPGVEMLSAVSRLIIDRSEGNPYFLEEFVRMFVEQGYIRHTDGRWQVTAMPDESITPLPSSLETLIRSRVDTLPADLRQTLQAAAVIGHEFEALLLAMLLETPDVNTLLERLGSRLMLQATATPGRWQFSHTIFMTVVYNSLFKARRQALHLKVAQWLEGRWSESVADQAEALAYHFGQAGAYGRALPYLLTAGEQAASRHASEEALLHFQRAAEYLTQMAQPDPHWQWRVAVGLGDVYRFVGKYAESAATLKIGLALTQDNPAFSDRRANIYRRLGETAQKQGDFATAQNYFDLAQAALGQPNSLDQMVEAARILIRLAWIAFAQGHFDQAQQMCHESLAHAQGADSLNELAAAENLLGGIYYHLGEWREALQHTTRAMVLHEQMGYTWGVAVSLSNLGILAFVAGHWPKAITFFKRALELRQEMGDVEGVTITHNNLGNAYRGQGELALAETHFRQSLEAATLFNMSYHIANTSTGLAQVLLWQGHVAAAREVLSAALNQAHLIGAQDVLAEAYGVEAALCLAEDKPTEALAVARQSAELAATIGNPSYEAAGWRFSAEAALQQGDLPLAESLLARARQALTQATQELEAGQLAALASRIYHRIGRFAQAESERRTAQEIFTRLGAQYFLHQLETADLSES